MTNGKPYSAADVERYYRGGMTPAEMHALERASLDDPFLADALEGYAFTPTPAADAVLLKAKLAERLEEREQTRIVFFQQPWFRIAAVLLLVAGAGWAVFNSFSPEQENTAVSRAPAPQKSTDGPFATDSVLPETYAAKEPDVPATDNNAVKESAPPARSRSTPPVVPSLPTVVDTEPTSDAARNDEAAYNNETRQRQASPAQITSASREAERPLLAKPGDTLRNIDIVLQPAETKVEEFVIARDAKRKGPSRQQQRAVQLTPDSLRPAAGWPSYDAYVGRNINTPKEFERDKVEGEVELQFDVNAEGEPVNIKVTKPLCSQCDKEAVRLLKEGPKWNAGGKGGRLRIKF